MIVSSILTVAAATALFADDGGTLLTGPESWACRKAHPARVHSVMDSPADGVLSLRGEWNFQMTTFAKGRRNSHDVPFFLNAENWAGPSVRKIDVPGCWEAQGVGESGPSECWEFMYDHSSKPIRHKAMGEGWYRRTVKVPADWTGRRVWLKVGGVKSCGWFWVNGRQAAHVYDYCGSAKYDVTDLVVPGEEADIAVQVSNLVPSRKGLTSAMHRWGGLYRDVELESTPMSFVDDAWIRADFDRREAEAHVEVDGPLDGLSVRVTVDGRAVEAPVVSRETVLRLPLRDFRPWSPERPNLYTGRVELVSGGKCVQAVRERFGVRKLEVRGREFYLNDRPFYVRGFGDDHVYPLTGITPADRETHLAHLRTARRAGFNFVRLHTHCEVPEYFEAADEAGILVQPELPYINGDIPVEHFAFDPVSDTKELWRNYRRHPSFAVYSGGNEGSFGPALDGALYRMVKAMDPDRLKICQDSQMAFINTEGKSDFSGGPVTEWPRGSIDPNRPFVCHEYLNLCVKLDARDEADYAGAWLPPVTRKGRTSWLRERGLDETWGDRLQDSQHALQAYWQKHGVECARADPYCDGFCFWTIVDVVVQQFESYTSQGLFDPFWRPKRCGFDAAGFARFNSPSCILADVRPDRQVFVSGESCEIEFLLSHYGEAPLKDGVVNWTLKAEKDLLRGSLPLPDVPLGPARPIGCVKLVVPAVDRPVKVRLVADAGVCTNDWPLWIFPQRRVPAVEGIAASAALKPALDKLYGGIRPLADAATGHTVVVEPGNAAIAEALARGQHVVVLGAVNRSAERKPSRWHYGRDVDDESQRKFRFGSDDIRLGWWSMGHTVGLALRQSRLLGALPHEGAISPLVFRIVGTGRKLPLEGVSSDDLVMVGEGGDACYAFVRSRRHGGGVLTEVDGLDLLSGYPEGTCILDGLMKADQGR